MRKTFVGRKHKNAYNFFFNLVENNQEGKWAKEGNSKFTEERTNRSIHTRRDACLTTLSSKNANENNMNHRFLPVRLVRIRAN